MWIYGQSAFLFGTRVNFAVLLDCSCIELNSAEKPCLALVVDIVRCLLIWAASSCGEWVYSSDRCLQVNWSIVISEEFEDVMMTQRWSITLLLKWRTHWLKSIFTYNTYFCMQKFQNFYILPISIELKKRSAIKAFRAWDQWDK